MSLLDDLQRSGALRTLDHAFAQSLRRLDPDTPDAVLAAAALASLAVAQGHAAFDPAQPRRLVEAALPWPDAQAWQERLAASRWVDSPAEGTDPSGEHAPLVLERGLLYLRRYREYERRLALGLQRIAAHAPAATDGAALAPLFAQLFPDALPLPAVEAGNAVGEDHQARAASVALHHSLMLVTGGPGTGKTTTIARLLVLLLAQARQAGMPAPRIALAAPTGRAAERMAESLRITLRTLQATGIDPALYAGLPTTGTTLHRLLGTIPDSPRFRHHADNPLPFDVVVVDEASMIDLPLMAKLVEAVADGARLVLLGDPDQLPSVEAGDVLSAILRATGDARALRPLPGDVPQARRTDSAFAGRRVHLQRGYRQSDTLALAPLAEAVRGGDAGTALALLRDGLPGVHFHEDAEDPLQRDRDRLLAHWQALAQAGDPVQALALAGRLRLLTALREGPQGARGLNARIEELLVGASRRGARTGHFHGQLLLITENSYRHRLFNGDIGICLRAEGNAPSGHAARGTLAAWFPGDAADAPRAFHPAALPAHESAFAMTVHKAQGSEFDEVWLQLPRRDNRVLSRELVYTGLTRARRTLHVAAGAEVLQAALARHAARISGLAWRLGGEAPRPAVDTSPEPVVSLQGTLF